MLDTEIVYCNNCRHLHKDKVNVICKHPDNYKMLDGNWAQPPHKVIDKSPSEINKNNDCGWYRVKECGLILEKLKPKGIQRYAQRF